MNGFEQELQTSGSRVVHSGLGSLKYFVITSLIAFVAVAVLMGYLLRTMAIDSLIHQAEVAHVRLAQVIGNETGDDVFGPWFHKMRGKPAAEIRAAPELDAIERKIALLTNGTRIFKIKAYDEKGLTIYSTDVKQIGENKSTNPGVMAGLIGLSSSRLVHRDQISHFEGVIQSRDLVESYVPHYDPGTGKVSGVFEIYGDATGVLAEINKRQWQLAVAVIVPLVLLYLALFSLVKRSRYLLLQGTPGGK